MPIRTHVYVDGFNLYYRSLKDTPYKWLDLKTLCSYLLKPENRIDKIKYFTTLVSGKLDPNKPTRQETYIRAVEKHIPEISVYYGHFLSNEIRAPLAETVPPQKIKVTIHRDGREKIIYAQAFPDQLVHVIKTEEKGSDVNIAVHLLNDAWLDKYDCAVVVSNDSDLAESLRIVKEERKKAVGLITPVEFPSKELIKHASFIKRIRRGVLSVSQLPNPIPGTNLYKPDKW
ncbi:MAG: NYN domain-containing protein [Mobilitalea sp.]